MVGGGGAPSGVLGWVLLKHMMAGIINDVYLFNLGDSMSLPQTVTINNTAYTTTDLSDVARAQLLNIQIVDGEIARLQQSVSISQAARQTYVAALMGALPAATKAKPAAKSVEKTAKPRAKKN